MKQSKTDIKIYKASDSKALVLLLGPLLLAFVGMVLALKEHTLLHWLGELLLSFFFLQTFILLHECGHLNFFKNRNLNVLFGNVFGVLSMIPFYTWQQMHNLHHRWTGWRDKDPTTEKTIEPSSSPIIRFVANIAWLLFIPVFYLSYKVSNYWNLFKIKRFLKAERFRRAVFSVIVYVLFYVLLIFFFGHFLLVNILPAFLISLVWKELVILTQHSHVEIPVSNGEEVKPVPTKEQVKYTRSFYLSPFVAKYFLFNFNLHEAHHAYPRLPAYWLDEIDLGIPGKPSFFSWFKKAKSMKGEDYIFRTSRQTGKVF